MQKGRFRFPTFYFQLQNNVFVGCLNWRGEWVAAQIVSHESWVTILYYFSTSLWLFRPPISMFVRALCSNLDNQYAPNKNCWDLKIVWILNLYNYIKRILQCSKSYNSNWIRRVLVIGKPSITSYGKRSASLNIVQLKLSTKITMTLISYPTILNINKLASVVQWLLDVRNIILCNEKYCLISSFVICLVSSRWTFNISENIWWIL